MEDINKNKNVAINEFLLKEYLRDFKIENSEYSIFDKLVWCNILCLNFPVILVFVFNFIYSNKKHTIVNKLNTIPNGIHKNKNQLDSGIKLNKKLYAAAKIIDNIIKIIVILYTERIILFLYPPSKLIYNRLN